MRGSTSEHSLSLSLSRSLSLSLPLSTGPEHTAVGLPPHPQHACGVAPCPSDRPLCSSASPSCSAGELSGRQMRVGVSGYGVQLVALVGAHSKVVTALCMWSSASRNALAAGELHSLSPRLPANPNPHLDSITNYDALLAADADHADDEVRSRSFVRAHHSPPQRRGREGATSSAGCTGTAIASHPPTHPPVAFARPAHFCRTLFS
jgi:hypothetical protein